MFLSTDSPEWKIDYLNVIKRRCQLFISVSLKEQRKVEVVTTQLKQLTEYRSKLC